MATKNTEWAKYTLKNLSYKWHDYPEDAPESLKRKNRQRILARIMLDGKEDSVDGSSLGLMGIKAWRFSILLLQERALIDGDTEAIKQLTTFLAKTLPAKTGGKVSVGNDDNSDMNQLTKEIGKMDKSDKENIANEFKHNVQSGNYPLLGVEES